MFGKRSERLRDLFFASPVLMLTAGAMAIDLIVCVVGLLTDRTIITGLPAWVKPTKFAISTGIYALSVVFIIRYTPIWKRTLRVVELLTGLALALEIVLIDLQAARHTTSHFNVATAFDRHVFEAMGAGIGVLWISSIVLAVATFRTRYKSRMWTVVVRYGMLLAVLGSGSGAFMAPPSHAQINDARTNGHMMLSGSHTIGGPDGGKGLPMLGWSTQHGDVRVAHFLGLHGLQVLASLALFLEGRRVQQGRATRIVSVAAGCYGSLFLFTLVEALLARPITDHDAVITSVWIGWAALSAGLFLYALRTSTAQRTALSVSSVEVSS